MKRIFLKSFLFLFVALMVTDQSARATCRKKRKKKKAATTQVAPAKNPEVSQVATGKQQQLVCRFISMGSGIDLNARKQLDELLVSIEKKSGQALIYDERSWGREGERDLCFHDNSSDRIQELYAQLKKLFNQNKRVFVELNAICK